MHRMINKLVPEYMSLTSMQSISSTYSPLITSVSKRTGKIGMISSIFAGKKIKDQGDCNLPEAT